MWMFTWITHQCDLSTRSSSLSFTFKWDEKVADVIWNKREVYFLIYYVIESVIWLNGAVCTFWQHLVVMVEMTGGGFCFGLSCRNFLSVYVHVTLSCQRFTIIVYIHIYNVEWCDPVDLAASQATLLQQSSIWYESFNRVNISFLFSSKKIEHSAFKHSRKKYVREIQKYRPRRLIMGVKSHLCSFTVYHTSIFKFSCWKLGCCFCLICRLWAFFFLPSHFN